MGEIECGIQLEFKQSKRTNLYRVARYSFCGIFVWNFADTVHEKNVRKLYEQQTQAKTQCDFLQKA